MQEHYVLELWNRSKLLNMIENINYISEVTEESYEKELSDDCLKIIMQKVYWKHLCKFKFI